MYHTVDKQLLHLQHQLLFLARLPFPKTAMSVQGYTCPTKHLVGPNSFPVHWAGLPAGQAACLGWEKPASGFGIPPQNPGHCWTRPFHQAKNKSLWMLMEGRTSTVGACSYYRYRNWHGGILRLLARFGWRYPNRMIFSSYTSLLCLPQSYVTHTFTFSLQW